MSRETSEETIRNWLRDYLCLPNNLIGRDGAVCPFVSPAMRAGSVEIRVREAGPAPTVMLLREMIRCALDEFRLIEWKGSNQTLWSLLLVIPDLKESACGLLDDAHRQIKPLAVRKGLMIGQFHPLCNEPAARNASFPVSRSPLPLVAIRPMAVHDILFLSGRREWFEEYRKRFGDRYESGRVTVDSLFESRYGKACAEYGIES